MLLEFDLLKVAESFLQSECYLLKAVKLFISFFKTVRESAEPQQYVRKLREPPRLTL